MAKRSGGAGPMTKSGRCKFGRAKTGPNKGKCRKSKPAKRG